jgi:hypothetical protein
LSPRARPPPPDPLLAASATAGGPGGATGRPLPGASGPATGPRLRACVHQLRRPRRAPRRAAGVLGVRTDALFGLLLASRVDPRGALLLELRRPWYAGPALHLRRADLGSLAQADDPFRPSLTGARDSVFPTSFGSAPARRANLRATGPVGESVASPTPVGRLRRNPDSSA